MRKRNILYFILIALLLAALLAGVHASQAQRPAPTIAPTATAAPTPTPMPLTLADQSGHPALMALTAEGTFDPDSGMRRDEMAICLAALLDGLPDHIAEMTDVAEGDAARAPVGRLAAAGLLAETAGEAFRPAEDVRRGELAGFLWRLADHLRDPEREGVRQLSRDVGKGLTADGDGKTSAEDILTRREIAVALERLAGRTPDKGRLILGEGGPVDVPVADEAWEYIADAVTDGETPRREPGVYRLCGWLYAADEDGELLTDGTYGVWSFGPDGRYTTGDERLDGYLAGALEASGANGLEGREALEAVYLYVKNNFEHKVTPRDQTPEEEGSTGWEFQRAERFFRYGGGTCYGYAATFGLLARCLGENARIVAATVNQFNGPHSFVVIPEDGIDWIYDVELEDTRPERHGDLDLFRIQNYYIYNYWYTPDW